MILFFFRNDFLLLEPAISGGTRNYLNLLLGVVFFWVSSVGWIPSHSYFWNVWPFRIVTLVPTSDRPGTLTLSL